MTLAERLDSNDFIELGQYRVKSNRIVHFQLGAINYDDKHGVKVITDGIYGGSDGQQMTIEPVTYFFAEGTPECSEIYQFFEYEPEAQADSGEIESVVAEESEGTRCASLHNLARPLIPEELQNLSTNALEDFFATIERRFLECYSKDIERICETASYGEASAALREKFPHFLFNVSWGYGPNEKTRHSVRLDGQYVYATGQSPQRFVCGDWIEELPAIIDLINETGRKYQERQEQQRRDALVISLTGEKAKTAESGF